MGGPLYIVPLDACFDGTASGFVLSPLFKLVSNPDQVGSGRRLDVASGNNYVSKNTQLDFRSFCTQAFSY
jgi:hypothetical protein